MTTTSASVTAGAHPMNKKLGFVAMLLSASGMGMVGFFGRMSTPTHVVDGQTVKYVLGDFLAFGRMTVGCLGFLMIILLAKRWHDLRSTKVTFSVVAGGLAIGASLALYVSSTLMTSIANAVFLIYTGPLFSAILAWIFLKERISLRNGIFLTLVFIGMAFTIGLVSYDATGLHIGLELGADPDFPMKAMGDMFALGSGVFYGLALFFYRYRGDIRSEVRGFWNFMFGAVGALAVMSLRMAFLDPATPALLTPNNWRWAIGMFLVCGFFAIGLLVVAGKHLRAVELSCVSYWECLVALVFGFLVFSESMTVVAALGGLFIILGGMGPIVYELVLAKKEHAGAPAIESIPDPEKTNGGAGSSKLARH